MYCSPANNDLCSHISLYTHLIIYVPGVFAVAPILTTRVHIIM